jgi:hypothetical protein
MEEERSLESFCEEGIQREDFKKLYREKWIHMGVKLLVLCYMFGLLAQEPTNAVGFDDFFFLCW